MTVNISSAAREFSKRLLSHPIDDLERFVEAEIMSGLPFIFREIEDTIRFQRHVADSLGVANAASDILIVGSAKTGFSLDPDRYFEPFGSMSDIDVAVVNADMFDYAWRTMLAWDYLTMRKRGYDERRWLFDRHDEVWSGWYDPRRWRLRASGGIDLSFPDALKPVRDLSYLWFKVFHSLSRYRHHPEIPRHRVEARLYRTRSHLAMYHASGLRTLRAKLFTETG